MRVAFEDVDGTRLPARVHEQSTPVSGTSSLDEESNPRKHLQSVARLVEQAAHGQYVAEWVKSNTQSESVHDHVAQVFAASGITDIAGRLRQVEAAMQQQQQMVLEKKRQKKERLREIAASSLKADHKPEAARGAVLASGGEDGSGSGRGKPDKPLSCHAGLTLASGLGEAAPVQGHLWEEVNAFMTQEEAIRFIMECQPFEYQPAGTPGSTCLLPRVEGKGTAVAQLLAMEPVPSEFVSTHSEFRRRLRIRKIEIQLEPSDQSTLPAPRWISLKDRKSLLGKHRRQLTEEAEAPRAPRKKEPKPWVVESAGELFDRPDSLRVLRETAPRYYIAVAAEVERRVFAEGFRVKRRCSIPCAATPKDALKAFGRSEERAGRAVGARPSILAVSLPPEVDVVRSLEGGFLIRAKELPPSCFTRPRRPGGMAEAS